MVNIWRELARTQNNVDIRKAAELNIDRLINGKASLPEVKRSPVSAVSFMYCSQPCSCCVWIIHTSAFFDTQFSEAVFHYKPDGQRWELGISTPAQREAAWKYGHGRIILVDGTFNVSDKNLLMFIVMVIDDDWKGVRLRQ